MLQRLQHVFGLGHAQRGCTQHPLFLLEIIMAFQHVNGKIGNMRKSQEWVVYPLNSADQTTRTIQSDNRIARVDLTTGKVLLSDGKGGHQGFVKLSPALGAKLYECPPDILEQLRKLSPPVGGVTVMGE